MTDQTEHRAGPFGPEAPMVDYETCDDCGLPILGRVAVDPQDDERHTHADGCPTNSIDGVRAEARAIRRSRQ